MKSSTMDRPSHAGLRHLALNVRDLAEMKRFYVELLGFAVEWEPDADNIYLSSGMDNLALHRSTPLTRGASTSIDQPPAGPSTLDHLGLIVREPHDVDEWAAFLESHGVVIDAPPRTHRDGA